MGNKPASIALLGHAHSHVNVLMRNQRMRKTAGMRLKTMRLALLPALVLHCFASAVWLTPRIVYAQTSNDTQPASVNLQSTNLKPALLEVVLNGQAQAVSEVLLGADGSVWVTTERFAQWRLRLPPMIAHRQDGQAWLPLQAISGSTVNIQNNSAQVLVTVPAVAFSATAVGVPSRSFEVEPAPFGISMNYDLQLQNAKANSAVSLATAPRNLSGLVELGAFSGSWTFTHQMLAPDVLHPSTYVRLDTTVQRDFPDQVTSLKIGDALGRSGLWGKSIRFAGLSYGTNFSIRPNLITYPLPQIRGLAAAPSAIDVFVNEQQRFNTNVGTGPFEVRDLPTVSGSGQIKVQTRDLLGRVQTFVVPFYAAPVLLKQGLHDYAIEVGAQRTSYGLLSNQYGKPFVHATERYGINDAWTLEARAEISRAQTTLGLGSNVLLGTAGIANVAAAYSKDAQGRTGYFHSIGFDRESADYNFGIRTERRTPYFAQLGVDTSLAVNTLPTRRTSANAGLPLGRYGAIGLAVTADHGVSVGQPQRTALASYSVNFGPRVGIAFSIGRNQSQQLVSTSTVPAIQNRRDTLLSLSISIALDGRMSSGATYSGSRSDTGNSSAQSQFNIQNTVPSEGGWGWRATGVRQSASAQPQTTRLDAEAQYVGQNGQIGTQVSQSSSGTAWRMSAQGAVVLMDNRVWLSRRLGTSYAAVRVGDEDQPLEGVRVFSQNRLLGRTNASGRIFIPVLPAYEPSTIAFSPLDAPLDVDFAVQSKSVVPPARAGVLVSFGARKMQAAMVVLQQDNGKFVPAGALAKAASSINPLPKNSASDKNASEAWVVVERGELFLPNTQGLSVIEITWSDERQNLQRCKARLPEQNPANIEAFRRIESLRCSAF